MSETGPLPVVVLISGQGTNLQALIDAERAGKIHARIQAVFSDNSEAPGLDRARRAGITAHHLARGDFPSRAAYERALAERIERYQPGLVVLAGFMRILGDDFVHRFRGSMLNIHPSLLPRFRGLDTHRRVLEAGDAQHGATVHFVTEELDGGPRIIQYRIPVRAGESEGALEARVHVGEYVILPRAVALIAERRLRLDGETVMLDEVAMTEPLMVEGESGK